MIPSLTRRDFIKGASCAAMGLAMGLPSYADDTVEEIVKSRVVLIRDKGAVKDDGGIDGAIIQQMLDQAMATLFDKENAVDSWKQIIKATDVVGIKSNEWSNLPTTTQVEQAIKRRVMDAGVAEENIGVDDRGVRDHPIFQKATALINARPLRSHAWSGVGSLIKNPIMFDTDLPKYHPNSCADLGAIWSLPAVKGKVRLNVLVMLTPLFHGSGWHHFDPKYTWPYKGLIVSTDPVAADSTGVRIFQARRREFFGEDRPITPTPHHIVIADRKFGLGNSDPAKIELVKLGWDEGVLI
ncbi:MAG: twin-arginine translocation signal domain-containing protein [Candidatus Zixiibacteriota bacterium]|nr:MAG: twin-arginine translocation signal domain-containing protein [candidate division Zixibacteria bacterium]